MELRRREFLVGATTAIPAARAGVLGPDRAQASQSLPDSSDEVRERLEVWMRFGQPLEIVIRDFQRTFDGWEAMGVNGIVLGRMSFRDDNGKDIPAFPPNPRIYSGLGVRPPQAPAKEFRDRRRQLDQMLDEARRRKWPVMIFAPDAGADTGGGWGAAFTNPHPWAARILDTLSQFPQVDGGIIDGPEWGYEIDPGHRSNIFEDLPDAARKLVESMHYDFHQLKQATDRLFARLHQLDAKAVTSYSGGGLLGATRLFHSDPELTSWMRFRTEAVTSTVKLLKGLMTEQRKDLRLGMGPRTAAFAPLCGYDFSELLNYLDYLLPKHYFWHRGVDGLYGTVYRWMRTLTEWNPGLKEGQALDVVKAWFGLDLPGVTKALDFERGFPDDFFTKVVATETRRALAATDSPERIIPWLDIGRRPHRGDPMGTGDFLRILEASRKAGLRRFLYHNYTHITPGEAEVMRVLCGGGKRELPRGLVLPDIDMYQ